MREFIKNLNEDIVYIIFFCVISLFLLVIAVVTIVLLASRQRIRQQISYEKELRTTQQEILAQILNQVSAELHDNIGQLLTLMRIQMEMGKIKNPQIGDSFDTVNNTLSDTIQQVRSLSHSLSTDLLERRGLLESIKNETTRLQQLNHFNIEFDHDQVEPSIENDQKLMVFRIFQELINNILKHSGANNVVIRLNGKDFFEFFITDDGKGYDVDKMLLSAGGAGLKNIIRRAELAHLNCTLKSMPQAGSSCLIRNM